MEHITSIRVRYKETDQMGVVYHGNYFTWFDIGRTDFLRNTMDISNKALEEKGVLLPVIEGHCKYIKPAKYDDEIIIKTELVKLKGVRLEFQYKLFRKEDNILIAEGYTTHAFVDKELTPFNFKKNYKEMWEILQKQVSAV
ncbi:acyl-CoA thioesterase [Tissierella sp. MSJ-40]|uniref:Acyl-CoA thioesterase n=1 Tax=Tissierella simiarum TaxID=2841534 RepID=A0ABS6E687_9FIRM|nr:thioesterase family protein [Tissierella simiarum]MBU5438436.1 acyl-CoA thioesterase [Tissierella simiarum]